MRRATAGTIAFGGLLLFGLAVVAAEPERVDLFTSGEGGYGRYRIPALTVTDERTVLALCEGRRKAGGLTGDIDIVLRRSLDGGATWLPMQVVADHGTDTLGNPCLVQDRTTKTLWLLFTKSPGAFTEEQIVAGEPPTSTTVWVTTSTDDGATWSAAREITATTKRDDWRWYGTGPGHGLQLASGRLLIPCYHSVAGTKVYRSHSVFSDDHGATWRLGGVAGDHTTEPQALARADGSIVLNARSIAKQGFRTLATSTDDGATWTDVRLDPTLTCPSCEGSLIEYASGHDGERKTWLFSNPPGPGRRNLTLRASSDEGATWPIAKVLDAGNTEYSSLARLPDGRVGVLYERSPGTVYRVIVSFLRLEPDWLTAAAGEFVVAPAEGPPLPVVSAAPPKPVRLLPAPGKDVPLDDPAWRDHLASKAAADAWREAVREAEQADRLAAYLERICGRAPERVKRAEPLPEAAIVVGAACPEEIRAEAAKLGPDGWILRTSGQRLYICGGGRQGTLYGIYAFLEDVLGCRWWAHDAEHVPTLPRIAFAPLDVRVTPPFLLHDLFNREAQINSGAMLWKARSKSTFQPSGHHNFYTLLADAAANKPDYWPFVETKDKQTGAVTFRGRVVAKDAGDFNSRVLHFNYLAPGMADDLAAALGREIVRRGGDVADWVYMAGQGDWYGGLDQSPESQAVYEEETWTDADGQVHRGASGPLLRLINQTAALVAAKHPGAQVGTLAYMSTDSPPGKTRPADNVWIWLPRLRYGITLSIEEAAAADRGSAGADPETLERVPTTEAEQEAAEARAAGARGPSAAEEAAAQRERKRAARRREAAIKAAARSRSIRRSIERWADIAPGRFLIWEYGVNYTNFLRPTPNLRAIAENIRWYHRIGVRGIMVQGNYTSTGGDLVLLKNYVWRKLLWNPTLEVEPLVREFCAGYYGPAGDDILAYVTALEDSVRGSEPIIADEFDTQAPFLTPALVATLEAALTRARAQVAGEGQEAFRQRVEEVAASLEAGEIWKPGKLAEKDGRLVRADLGNADTQARAESLARAARGSGVTEMACAVTQTRRMLAANGGPLQLLAAGGVSAKVAPRQGTTRLWQVARDGRVLLEKSSLSPGSDLFDVVGEPGANRIELVGETEYGSWDPTPDHLQRETISLEPDGRLHWKATLERTNKTAGDTAAARIETRYAATKPEEVTVEYDVGSGWQPLSIAPFTGRGRPLRDKELKGKPPEPSIVEIEPRSDFRLRITRPGAADAVIDTIAFPKIVAACAVWVPKDKAVKTYVWGEPVTAIELGAVVPLCDRTITVEPR